MTPKTSIVHDTEMKGKNSRSYVSNEMNIFRYLAVRDHAGRTTAETSRQLELNSAAQVASVTMVNKWRGWTVETLKEIRGDEQVCSTTSVLGPSTRYSEALNTNKVD